MKSNKLNRNKPKNILVYIGYLVWLIVGITVLVAWYYTFGFEIPFYKTPEFRAMNNAASKIKISSGKVSNKYQNDFSYALGKPLYAKITIVFTPKSGYTKQDVFKDIVEGLEINNFIQDRIEVPKRTDYYHAYLPQTKFNVSASVIKIKDENNVNVYFDTYYPPTSYPTTPTPKLKIYDLRVIQNQSN